MKQFAVYFMTNWTNEVLYTGVTSDLPKRLWEHQNNVVKGFTQKYNLHKLAYYEWHDTAESAILREKRIKRWNRAKKDFLVNQMNPNWRDLSENITGSDPSTPPAFADASTRLRSG